MDSEGIAIQLAQPGWPTAEMGTDQVYKHHFHAEVLLRSSAGANVLQIYYPEENVRCGVEGYCCIRTHRLLYMQISTQKGYCGFF